MDTTARNRFIKSLADLTIFIENSEVIQTPFPYILIENGIGDDFPTIEEFKKDKFSKDLSSNGRITLEISNLLDESLEHKSLHDLIINKFNLKIPTPSDNIIVKPAYSTVLWEDSSDLDIQDIHLDFLKKGNAYKSEGLEQSETNSELDQLVFSMHIYLPDDDNHINLGTSLYEIPSSLPQSLKIQADFPINIPSMIMASDVDKLIKIKQIPYKRGVVFIHPTSLSSWHQAPIVPTGYIRKSMMFRWDYSSYTSTL